MTVIRSIGEGLLQGLLMLWETFWALVLGFVISGAVQAFVSRERMRRALGRRTPATVARATFLGMVSSSCSYAAAAMARSLFAKGADLTVALVFMMASTNWVVELGIVLALLIGWQFTASELLGGLLMIALFALVSRWLLPERLVASARARVDAAETAGGRRDISAQAHESPEDMTGRAQVPPPVRTVDGWADAARFAIADLRMVRRELVAGFAVAGLLAALVPGSVWTHLFVSGHGLLSSIENVVVGPLIAVLSFVCSIGNVPLAAALWKGGISFGGVVAFIFADLIAFPLLLIQRRYYGTRLTLRILAGLWLVMSVSGLAVEALFGALNAIPQSRPARIGQSGIALDATLVLNLLALIGVAALLVLSRRAPHAQVRHARDPECGMQVERASASARRVHDGDTEYFCSPGCAERYDSRHAADTAAASALVTGERR